jgi:hypothetical protein
MPNRNLLFSLFLLSACGSGVPDPGYTECGELKGKTQYCSPGQYCDSAGLNICDNGCTSSVNCPDGDECVNIDSFDGVGTCEADAAPGAAAPRDTNDFSDPTLCLDTCDMYAFMCGMEGEDQSDCRDACSAASANGQDNIAACLDSAFGRGCESPSGCW